MKLAHWQRVLTITAVLLPLALSTAHAQDAEGAPTPDGAEKAVEAGPPALRLTITNEGSVATGPLNLTAEWKDGERTLSAPLRPIGEVPAKGRATIQVTLPDGTVESLRLAARVDGGQPSAAADGDALPIELIAGGGLALLVVLLLLFVALSRRGRHPVVQALEKNPAELLGYELRQLPMVHKALSRARRLDAILAAAKVPVARWKRAVEAAQSPERAARAFAETLGATVENQVEGGDAWIIDLPQLALRFARRTAVAVLSGPDVELGDLVKLSVAIYAEGSGPTSAIALDLTDSGRGLEVARGTRRVSFVVLSSSELRDVLFSENPAQKFQTILARQRPASEISPYQTAGGVEDEGLFFGRERELRMIADRTTLNNFILVGPRQAGKSSLMKAVRRRLSARTDVEVHQFTVFKDDLAGSIARQLGRPRPETAGEFMKMAAGKLNKPRVFLVDEADGFIVQDAKSGYPLSQAMRALAEDGRAYFILAGFWHLYAAAVLTPNNPLRNFGEVVRLTPLDREAARSLVTQPMLALQMQYESPALVERLLEETGCRAHLLVVTCKGLLAALGPNERIITQKHLEHALYRNADLADELKSWRRDPLGRAVLRAALIGEPPTRGELRERLAHFECHPSTELFTACIDRLELAFHLTSNTDGKLVCPVPLLRRYVEREADLEKGLRQDVADYRAAS